MDIGLSVLVGAIYRWLFSAIKHTLHLSDQSAAWGIIVLALLTALGYNMVTGGFAGLEFSAATPGQGLAAVASAWAIVLSTAQSLFAVTKERK